MKQEEHATATAGIARSEPFESDRSVSRKTARSEALRGGLIDGHIWCRMNPNGNR
jgi:hypothetical protein